MLQENIAIFVEQRISQDIEIVVEQNNLKMHIKNVCNSLMPKIEHFYPKDKLILYDTHKIVYCLQPKVGSSSILKMFVNLLPEKYRYIGNSSIHIHVHSFMYKTFSMKTGQHETTLEKLVNEEHYFAFSFVRHPFDRLVSAYIGSVALLSHFHKGLALSKFTLFKCEIEVNPIARIP